MDQDNKKLFQELESSNNEGLLATWIKKLEDKLHTVQKIRRRREFDKSPEGIRFNNQLKELEKINADNLRRWQVIHEARLLEAKRKLVLQIEADRLLKESKIDDNDPRLASILYEIDNLHEVIADAFIGR